MDRFKLIHPFRLFFDSALSVLSRFSRCSQGQPYDPYPDRCTGAASPLEALLLHRVPYERHGSSSLPPSLERTDFRSQPESRDSPYLRQERISDLTRRLATASSRWSAKGIAKFCDGVTAESWDNTTLRGVVTRSTDRVRRRTRLPSKVNPPKSFHLIRTGLRLCRRRIRPTRRAWPPFSLPTLCPGGSVVPPPSKRRRSQFFPPHRQSASSCAAHPPLARS